MNVSSWVGSCVFHASFWGGTVCFMITLELQGEPGALVCLNGKDTVTCALTAWTLKMKTPCISRKLFIAKLRPRQDKDWKQSRRWRMTPLIRIPFSVRRVCVDQDQIALILDVVIWSYLFLLLKIWSLISWQPAFLCLKNFLIIY